MAKRTRKEIVDRVATEFTIEIVEEALKRFNITYDKLDTILRDLGYWERLNDSEVAAVGAHYGIEPVMEDIAKALGVEQ